jgi:hypothetical protein
MPKGMACVNRNYFNKRVCCKTPVIPFDKLRVNGIIIGFISLFPFVVSLSNHELYFCNRLKKGRE